MLTYEIQYINRYGHIVYSFQVKKDTDKKAIMAAKKQKFMYPECWIEILCHETRKRIYA